MSEPSTPPVLTPTEHALWRALKLPPFWIRRFKQSLSIPGILIGTLFFAVSLTPSLLPRGWGLQAVLSGFSLSAGYGIGVTGRWLWGYLELPLPRQKVQRILLWGAAALCAAVAITFLWRASAWQDSVRVLMEMGPVEGTRPFRVGLVAYIIFSVVLGLSRLFHLTFRTLADRLDRGLPRRVANVVALVLAVAIFWIVTDGLVVSQALRVADSTFGQLDAREDPDTEAPEDPMRTGSQASLISWEALGRTGRDFVMGAPSAHQIASLAEAEAMDPIRVYVGLNAAETVQERADLALAELKRADAFSRSVLIIATPTGTGWIDPAAIRTVEHLHRGDLATVALQYSYLPSWLTLMSDTGLGAESADALFDVVYRHWASLPADDRPELYLHGLSLGALNSQQSVDLYDIIADPFHGALWVGPPFRSRMWRDLTRQRSTGSPAWLPRFRDGSVVRFMNQWEMSHPPERPWGPLRIIFLQYASDPITFFEPEAFFRRPEWLNEDRAPDVSEQVRWYPVVTAFQLMADLAVGDTSPLGYGHVYAPEHYLDAWVEVTNPPGWTESGLDALRVSLEGGSDSRH